MDKRNEAGGHVDVTIGEGELRDLARVAATAAKSPTPSSSSSVLLEARDDQVAATANNGERSVQATLPAQVRAAGSVLLPGSVLRDAARFGDPVSVTAGDDTTVLRQGPAKVNLRRVDPAEHPGMIRAGEEAETVTVPSASLRSVLAGLADVTGKDPAQPKLTAVCLEVGQNGVDAAATDSYRVLTRHADLPDAGGEVTALLPRDTARALADQLPETGQVTLSVGNVAHVAFHGGALATTLVAGPYFNWRQLVTGKAEATVRVDRDELVREIDRGQLGGADTYVRLNRNAEGKIRLTGWSPGEAAAVGSDTTVAATVDGEMPQITFSAALLRNTVQMLAAGTVSVSLTAGMNPAVLDDGAGSRGVVMPARE